MKVFVSSKVNGQQFQEINRAIKKIIEEAGFQAHLPQEALPVKDNPPSIKILVHNEGAIDRCDIVLAIFDYLDTGSAMELGRARARNKKIVAFRSPEHEKSVALGKMLEGLWQRIPARDKASSLDELKEVMRRLNNESLNSNTVRN